MKISFWFLLFILFANGFGYRLSPQFFTGNYRTIDNSHIGYTIQVSPYWRLTRSNTIGIRTLNQAVLIASEGVFFGKDNVFIISKKTTNQPSLSTAIEWSNEDTRYDAREDLGEFLETDLNGYTAFVAQGWHRSRTQSSASFNTMVVVLGDKSEFVIHHSTTDVNDLPEFYDMLYSFQIKDGF